MATYTITSYGTNTNDDEWTTYSINGSRNGLPVPGDTIKLGNDLGSPGSPLTGIEQINIPSGVIFDGQGYKIYININRATGAFYMTGGTIQNVSIMDAGASTLRNHAGYLCVLQSYGNLYNCHTDCDVNGNCGGGLIGTLGVGGTLVVERCTSSGNVSGFFSGGIVGYIVNTSINMTINECYHTGNITYSGPETSGGICGLIGNFDTVTISNCYSTGTSADSRNGGIASIWESFAMITSITIQNCYSLSASLIAINTNDNVMSNVIVKYSVASTLSNAGTFHEDSIGNSTTLTDIQGQLYEPTGDSAGNWSTDYWTAGSGSDYPMLGQFALGPWTGYTAYNTSATLSAPYTGGGDRVAAESGGGGDPHMNPLIGKPYTLPKTEDTFLLIDNKVEHDRLIIKGKCWYLPKEQYQDPLNRAFDRNTSKLNKLKDLFENGTFFKYIKIEYKGKEVIIDMDDLSLKNYDGKANLYGGKLPASESTRFKYGDMLTVGGITGSEKGLYTATSTKTSHDTAYRTIMRTVEINTLNNKLTIELARDRKNIARRNSIKLFINGNASKFGGALVRKDVQVIDF